jgi:hypothetical protein
VKPSELAIDQVIGNQRGVGFIVPDGAGL